MFPLVSLATIVPVLYLGLSGHTSLAGLLVGGFFLGIGGTAISALTTVKLVNGHGIATPFIITACVLAAFAVLSYFVLRDALGRPVPSGTMVSRLVATSKLRITWQALALDAVAFGGYVAFSVYLPTYLKTAYHLTQDDAANRTAGFVLLAVVMRPVGGWLAGRLGPVRVLATGLAVVLVFAVVQAFTPSLAPLGTIAFLAMAAALGACSGAVFTLVAMLAPPDKVGSVTGVVGAAGGLGGFIPPLDMGLVYGQWHNYEAGLLALAVVTILAILLTVIGVRNALTANAAAAVGGAGAVGAAGAAGKHAARGPRDGK